MVLIWERRTCILRSLQNPAIARGHPRVSRAAPWRKTILSARVWLAYEAEMTKPSSPPVGDAANVRELLPVKRPLELRSKVRRLSRAVEPDVQGKLDVLVCLVVSLNLANHTKLE